MSKFILMTDDDGQTTKEGGDHTDYEDFDTLEKAIERAKALAPYRVGEPIEVYERVSTVVGKVGPVEVSEG